MKIQLTLLLFLSFFSIGYAQKAQNIYFFKNNGKQVTAKNEADFIRIIQEPDSGETNYKFFEYYQNGNRKKLGEVSSFDPLLLSEGIVMNYDSLGKKTHLITYRNGKPEGSNIMFFPDGKIKRETIYSSVNPPANQMIGYGSSISDFMLNSSSKIMYDADSTGKINIQDGNGHLKIVNKSATFDNGEEGDYKDGLKSGLWTGYDLKANTSFRETYEANKLISGESVKDGKIYKYTTSMQAPEFGGGQAAWNRFIATTTRYPADAQKSGIRGKVYTSFVVDGKGRITDIKIERSVYPSLDNEAIRVLQAAPYWESGKQRGIPVKVRYNQTFNFNL